jgi:hypothetical protein
MLKFIFGAVEVHFRDAVRTEKYWEKLVARYCVSFRGRKDQVALFERVVVSVPL